MPSAEFKNPAKPPQDNNQRQIVGGSLPTVGTGATGGVAVGAGRGGRQYVAEKDILDLEDNNGRRRKEPYFTWENRYGSRVPRNSQDTLINVEGTENEMDPREHLRDSKYTRIKLMQQTIETDPEDPQEKIRRKYMMSSPDSFSRNESIFGSYDPQNPVVQESTKKHADLLDMRQRLKNMFRFMHSFFFIGGIGFLIAGYMIHWLDTQMLGNLNLHLYDMSKKLYFGGGAALVIIAVLGQVMVTIRRFKILTWLVYLLLLFVGCSLGGTCMFTSLRNHKNHEGAKNQLFDLMNLYDGKNHPATKKWDTVHKGYQCCGVNYFTDWTDSPFGRTSLRTPMSCCRNATKEKDPFCGQNLLPVTEYEVANEIIFADGCIKVMLRKADIWYLSSGLYAGFVTFFILIHWAFCLFLISSHRL